MDGMRAALQRTAQERFSFLIAGKRFSERPVEQSTFATALFYIGEQLGVENQLDFRDDAVDVYLLKLQDHKPPSRGIVLNGERMRESLPLLLRDVLHIQDERLDILFGLFKTPGRWGYQSFADVLRAAGDVVERYIDLILEQPLDVLFLPRTRRKPLAT